MKLTTCLQKIFDKIIVQAGGDLASTTPLPILSGNRLPLWSIFCEALAFPWQYRHLLWKWILVCGVVLGLTDFAANIFDTHESAEERGFLDLLYELVFAGLDFVLFFTLYTVFCIRCHRLILLGPTADADVFPLPLGERESYFLLFLLVIYGSITFVFICGIFFEVFLDISDTRYADWPFFTLSMIPLSYMLGRYCMVFPVTAIDIRPTFKWAWEQSKGIGWRLGILAGFLPWLFFFIYNGKLFFELNEHPFVFSLITEILRFVFATIEVAVLSIAFRELSRFESPQQT